MQDVKRTQGLADAAAHLCFAYDELRAAGYNGWSGELRMLLAIIDAEIEWLQNRDSGVRVGGT
jgi:hypothetical protein